MQIWGRAYVEEPHAPIFHIRALRAHGVGKTDFPLILDGGLKLATIEQIVAHYDPAAPPDSRMVPEPEAEPALHAEVMTLQHEARFGMGTGTVHWAYYHLLQHRRLIWPSLTTGVPWSEKALLTPGYGGMKRLMFKGLGLSAADAAAALDTVRRAWDATDERLSDGRRYLAGDRLTLADLAFATSGAPMIMARGYGGHLPQIERLPEPIRSVSNELASRPSGRFIQRLYDVHRG
jgi:glutathione S-transferase